MVPRYRGAAAPSCYRHGVKRPGDVILGVIAATATALLLAITGAIPEGPSFFCPHCGALYAVTYARLSSSDSNVARCVVCGQIMDKWDSTKVPIFKLVHRPDDY
jgi:predicted Zn finger-like uncharacterized protein